LEAEHKIREAQWQDYHRKQTEKIQKQKVKVSLLRQEINDMNEDHQATVDELI